MKGNLKEWADRAEVECVRLPGYWMHKKGEKIVMGQKPSEKEKVILFLHGGAYVALSAHPDCPPSGIAKLLMKHSPGVRRTFCIEYRLTVADDFPAKNPFPTQLIDALAGYNYLVNVVGYDPANIIVMGDSAGGHLALSLVRYLVENVPLFPELPGVPGGLLLLSPWCDMSGSNTGPGSSAWTLGDVDYLRSRKTIRDDDAPRAFVSPHGLRFAWKNAYISPACNDLEVSFKGFPKSFVIGGDAELLLDQIRVLQQRMRNDLGAESVIYYEAKDSVHDFMVFLWQEPQRTETAEAISKWISSL